MQIISLCSKILTVPSRILPNLFLAAAASLWPGIAKAVDGVSDKAKIPSPTCNFLPSTLCGDNLDSVMGGAADWLISAIIAVSLIMIVVSGAQMASASDSPDRLKAAKGRLAAAVVSLVFLVLFRAILDWLGISV